MKIRKKAEERRGIKKKLGHRDRTCLYYKTGLFLKIESNNLDLVPDEVETQKCCNVLNLDLLRVNTIFFTHTFIIQGFKNYPIIHPSRLSYSLFKVHLVFLVSNSINHFTLFVKIAEKHIFISHTVLKKYFLTIGLKTTTFLSRVKRTNFTPQNYKSIHNFLIKEPTSLPRIIEEFLITYSR